MNLIWVVGLKSKYVAVSYMCFISHVIVNDWPTEWEFQQFKETAKN